MTRPGNANRRLLRSLFLVAWEIIKILVSAGDEEKKLTAEHAETAEIFLPKGQKHKAF
jgi:hypothetical protein